MKIALITIHWTPNYGAALQAFSTVQVLKEYGDVSVIDYRSKRLYKSMALLRIGCKSRDILRVGKDIFRLFSRYRVIRKFKRFSYEHLNMTKIISTGQDFNELSRQFDIFISGSDQIWNPKVSNENGKIDGRYFLDFAGRNKKISYASSIGAYNFSKDEIPRVRSLLGQYNQLAVRESGSVKYLEKLLKRPVAHVLDPTLLLTKDQWLQAFETDGGASDNPYILVYALKKDKALKQAVETVANYQKIRVITIDQDPFTNFKNEKHIRDAGPKEFVKLFSKASYVVTNSFHGVCFSLIFSIPFVVTTPPAGINRIESLLAAIGASDRIVKDSAKLPVLVADEIDFSSVNNRLDRLRIESMKYIKNAIIENPC